MLYIQQQVQKQFKGNFYYRNIIPIESSSFPLHIPRFLLDTLIYPEIGKLWRAGSCQESRIYLLITISYET